MKELTDDKLHARLDPESGVCMTPCLMIVRPTGNESAPLCYHGFAGDGTATIYTDRARAEQVLRTLNPEQGWLIQRVMMVSKFAVEKDATLQEDPPR